MSLNFSSILSPTGTLRSESLAYDAFGRMDALTVDDDTVAYGFHHDTAFPTTTTVSRDGAASVSQTRAYDRRGRLDSIDASDGTATLFSANQTFDTHGRVTRITLDGGAYWDYGYDAMGQVTSGVKKDSGGTALPGYTFGYGFDTIGNRETATRESHTDDYWTNVLNQITAIEYQGYHHVLGSADSAATVTVGGLATQRSNSLFYGSVSGSNTYEEFEIRGVLTGAGDGGTDAISVIDAAAYIPESSNTFSHDASGNLIEDAEWLYTWDAENRLVQIETRPSVVTAGTPQRRLTFEYDSQSRRTRKTVETWDGTAWQTDEDIRFLWNDWLLSAELEADTLEPIRSYTWGLDLAGTRDQTGGIGGLSLVKHHKNGEVSVPLYSTNGNVRGYWEIDAAELVAEFEYGPFGDLLRATGEETDKHPIRWSSKYEDVETGLVYYGYRFFDPATGRWLSRDPMQEDGGVNLYSFLTKNGINDFDYLGMVRAGDWVVVNGVVEAWDAMGWVFAPRLARHSLNKGRNRSAAQDELDALQSHSSFTDVFDEKYFKDYACKRGVGTYTKPRGSDTEVHYTSGGSPLFSDIGSAYGHVRYSLEIDVTLVGSDYNVKVKFKFSDTYDFRSGSSLRPNYAFNRLQAAGLASVYDSSGEFEKEYEYCCKSPWWWPF